MNPAVTHDTSTILGGVSIGAGVFTWMDVHANSLGFLVALMSGIAYIVFITFNILHTRSQVKTKESIKREIIQELLDVSNEEESEAIKRAISK